MPAALKKPTLDELYRRLRDLDYNQIDERMAVMLNAILQLEDQGECRESATEAVLMIGYTTEGISNQEQTRWLSWNVDGGVRGFDLARNPGLNNNTEYGAGEFPLPTRPTVRSTSQSSSRVPSMSRTQQTTEAYPDLGVLKKELEKTQKERNKANLDRDQAKLDREKVQLERDQAVNERDQALRLLEMQKAEHQQELRVRENAANRDQLRSELDRIEQRQRELDAQKGARPKERVVTSSRPESRMEVDEAPRARARFNLDREAREHMSEGLEVWIPNDADVLVVHDNERSHEKTSKEYRQFQAEIGPEAFKRPLLTHRNAITTGWKRVGKMSRDNTKARESILEEDLAKNVSLSLHNSFGKGGLSVDPGETWIHEKEVLTKQILLLIYYIYYINENAA